MDGWMDGWVARRQGRRRGLQGEGGGDYLVEFFHLLYLYIYFLLVFVVPSVACRMWGCFVVESRFGFEFEFEFEFGFGLMSVWM